MDKKIKTITLTVLDYETTGSISGHPNQPWQIGLVTLKNGIIDPSSTFESLLHIDPNRPFNPHAPGRHARIRDQLAQAPLPHQIWKKIQPRLTNIPLCAHNIATEKKFLQRMAPMHSFGPWIDTLRLARKAWPKLPSYALSDLIESLHLKKNIDSILPNREPHDALYDAVASAILLQHLLDQPHWNILTLNTARTL